ncbi:Ig-like domain-containing protein [bacterium]|nr:Ig-like domain-containing protein [bacterium]MBU1636649.1 Ig-like domain-containing protein [bacterium]MBU1921031.1 Ig-like domain-containing protein [bacterium]
MKRWQSLFITAGLLLATALWAVPTFTPLLDGSKDVGWGATPDEATTSLAEPVAFNLDSGLYVTDDNEYIYFGFWADPDPWDDAMNPHIHILIDVGSTAGGGTYAAWGAGGVAYNMPYRPEYDLVTQWNTSDQNIQFTGLNTWSGGWVQQPEIMTDAGGGGQWTEIAISRLALGDPVQGETLNLTMWLRPSWGTAGGNCVLPEEAGFPSANGATAHPITVQFPYTIQTVYGDVNPPCLALVRQIDETSVELVFSEPMDELTLANSANYTMTGWFQTGFRYVTATTVGFWYNPGFVSGTPYTVEVGAGITDLAGNPMDPSCDELSWNGQSYADVTFLVHDPFDVATNVTVRGTWNFYHEYDAGGFDLDFDLYDDGTHGDVTAGDNDWTLLMPLVPNGGTPNFRWKWLQDGNWQPGADNEFTLPDLNPLTVEGTIPYAIEQEVTVTFDLNMNCMPCADVDSVTIAGPLGNWDGYSAMTDDGDGTYSYNIVFPIGTSASQEYKYRYHWTNEALEVVTEWEGVPNRALNLDDSSPTQILPQDFFNDVECTFLTQAVEVTFYCDMQCVELGATVDGVDVVGTFNCWGATPILLADDGVAPDVAAGDGQWTATVNFPIGSITELEYKFRRIENGDPDPIYEWEDAIGNRTYTLLDDGLDVDLPNAFFNNWVCDPVDLTIIRDGDNVHLDWNGPSRVYYQVWEHTSPVNVSVDGTLLDTTPDSFFDVAIPVGEVPATFYQIVATTEIPE